METSASFEARYAPSSYPTIGLAGGAAIPWATHGRAQQDVRVRRIGFLSVTNRTQVGVCRQQA
jgi:hypothetical protein